MKCASRFKVQHGWKLMLLDMGINPAHVLTLAGLPGDLFAREDSTLKVDEYYGFWQALEQVAEGIEFPVLLGEHLSAEAFDPPVFAALSSANLNEAFLRLQQFKPLIGPMLMSVSIDTEETQVEITCYGNNTPLPRWLGATEAVFFTKLARIGTRQGVKPVRVELMNPPKNAEAYQQFFGVEVQPGNSNRIVFSAADAEKPFLTHNEGMWNFFAPELRKRLTELEAESSVRDRVTSTLLELLPSGHSSMEKTAEKMALSKRTLQRKLQSEGTNYQILLQDTRSALARQYLMKSNMHTGEISFLLGFRDTNSFLRAFNQWTGQSPGQFRKQQQTQNQTPPPSAVPTQQ